MERVFVDTNIIFDCLGQRAPFFSYARDLFALGEEGKVMILISTMSYISVEYILRKRLGAQRTKQALAGLRTISRVCTSGKKETDLSLASEFSDFEDAFQYYSAINNQAEIIITRNPKDYVNPVLPIMSAEEYMKSRS